MYAVVRTGGKQHRVAAGDTVVVERIKGDVGDSVQLADIILLGTDNGAVADKAALAKAKVQARILDQNKDDKVIVFKFKRRKGYKRTRGHRQPVTTLMIEQIEDGSGKTVKAAAPAKPVPKAPAKKTTAKAKAKAKAAEVTEKSKVEAAPAAKTAEKKPAEKKAAAKPKATAKPKAPAKAKAQAKPKAEAKAEPPAAAKKAPAKKAAPKKTDK